MPPVPTSTELVEILRAAIEQERVMYTRRGLKPPPRVLTATVDSGLTFRGIPIVFDHTAGVTIGVDKVGPFEETVYDHDADKKNVRHRFLRVLAARVKDLEPW